MSLERGDEIRSRQQLRMWIGRERAVYADQSPKYGAETETRRQLIQDMREQGFGERHVDLCLQYVKRAQVLGAETHQGRQAMGKAIVSLMHLLETAICVHGDMPEPGHPSGEIKEWLST